MKTQIKISKKNGSKRSLRSFALFFSFMVIFTIGDLGSPLSAGNSSHNSKNMNTHAERQIWNGSAWVSESQFNENKAELMAQKEAEHQNFMNYVYMALGLGVVLGLAWFTQSERKKKGGFKGNESHPIVKHHHSIYDKRYGTGRAK